jgi:hypothetical protein
VQHVAHSNENIDDTCRSRARVTWALLRGKELREWAPGIWSTGSHNVGLRQGTKTPISIRSVQHVAHSNIDDTCRSRAQNPYWSNPYWTEPH